MEHEGHHLSIMAPDEEFHRAYENVLVHARKRLGQTHRLCVNGRFLKSKNGTFQTFLPSDSSIAAGRFQKATAEQMHQAVAAAKAAGSFWREFGWQQRVAYLRKAAELMANHEIELAALLSLEVGKNRLDAFAEVAEAIQTMRYYCQEAERHQGFAYRLNGSNGTLNQCALRPHGVWALITPFNFPLSVPAGAATAALIGGNTIVFKPSSRASLIGARFNALLHEAGLPVGVFNFITGSGRHLCKAVTEDPEVNGLAFSGSTETGMNLLTRFSNRYPRPCVAAMGSNNPVIVMPTAKLEDAAEGIARSAFGVNGQHCAGCARVYVHRKITRQLTQLLVEKTAVLKIGDPLDRETFLGPLIDRQAVARYQQAVAWGRRYGRLRVGGSVLRKGCLADGFYVEPALFDQLPSHGRLFQTELLVPVLVLAEVKSLQEAIGLANESIYGRGAGIFTRVEAEQVEFFNHIEAASAYCNRREGATTGGWPGIQSVGGWKASSSSCRSALGPFFVPQFLREQSQTIAR